MLASNMAALIAILEGDNEGCLCLVVDYCTARQWLLFKHLLPLKSAHIRTKNGNGCRAVAI